MSDSVVPAVISGICSIVSALGAVFLKDYLETRRSRTTSSTTQSGAEAGGTSRRALSTSPFSLRDWALWKRPASIVAGSFVIGLVTRALRPLFEIGSIHYESVGALAILVALALWLVVYHRRKRSQTLYQLENCALWTGFASGWSAAHGEVWGHFLEVLVPWWVGSAIVGAIVVTTRRATIDDSVHS